MLPGIVSLAEMYIFTNSIVCFVHKSSPVIVPTLMTNGIFSLYKGYFSLLWCTTGFAMPQLITCFAPNGS